MVPTFTDKLYYRQRTWARVGPTFKEKQRICAKLTHKNDIKHRALYSYCHLKSMLETDQ